MKALKYIISALAIDVGTSAASAQYYEIANQLPSLISPALSGSLRYKGFVDLSGTAGMGDNRANFAGISTTQGFQYADWFFMGAGLGVDVAVAHQPEKDMRPQPGDGSYWNRSRSKTKAMIPVFSDFRFNIGGAQSTSFYIDLKVGAAWFIGNSYLEMDTGCMGNNTQFYFKPSIGVRVPVMANDSRKAINIGVSYQLLTSNNNYYYWQSDSMTLNNLGLTIGYEW